MNSIIGAAALGWVGVCIVLALCRGFIAKLPKNRRQALYARKLRR